MSPRLDPRISSYVQAVRGAIAADPAAERCPDELISKATVDRIQDLAADLVAEPLDLAPEQCAFPEEGYGRHMLYEDEDYGFVVIAMCWPEGIQGATHDHGTWGVVAVAQGSVMITNYERLDDGSEPEHCELRAHDQIVGRKGAVGYVLPPELDFHRVGNGCCETQAISIHTYGRDIKECNFLCPDTGKLMLHKLDCD